MGRKTRPITVADSETDPFKVGRIPRPFLWGWYDGTEYREFEQVGDFVAFVSRTPQICYAHNGGRFDWHFILDYIPELSDIMIINGRLAQFKIGECEFRDSWNILPVPLSAYQKTEIDYALFEPEQRDRPEVRAQISAYLYDDCRFLHQLVSEFVAEFGRGMTIAGTAMKQWRKIAKRDPPNDFDGEIYERLRPYYYGGRCQAFEPGIIGEPFKLADINSAYPYAMLSEHPISTDYMELSAQEMAHLADDQLPTAFLTVRAESRGAFPMRQDDGSLGFPDDDERRVYHVTGHEYIAGLETGTIIRPEILGGFVFDETTNFADFVNHYYELRNVAKANGDIARTLFYKLVMNSLYGKFAANPENYRNFCTVDPSMLDESGQIEDGEGRIWEYSGEFGRHCLIGAPQPEEAQRYYNLATGASITGYVRAFLWRAICKSGGVIYCDTDSIAARDLSSLDYGPRLGQWELESEFDFGAVAGKKLYAFRPRKGAPDDEWKVASKGVKLSPSEIVRIARGETVEYVPDRPVFSVHKAPHFMPRKISRTGVDAPAKGR